MRLLFVLPEYLPQEGGGIITFYRWLLPELVRQGHSVDVVVGSGVTQASFLQDVDGVRVSYLGRERFRALAPRFSRWAALPSIVNHLAAAWGLFEQAARGEGHDAVEVVDWGLLALPWVFDSAVPPTLIQLHGSVGQISRHEPVAGQELLGFVAQLLEAAAFSRADRLQTYSARNAADWQGLGREVTVIAPALPSGASPDARERRAPPLVVGRLQIWKGPDVLCQALSMPQLRDAPVIDWVGRDTRDPQTGEAYSASLARRFPGVFGRRVVALGSRPAPVVREMQRAARVVVVPSTWDVFNFTAAEAMAQGAVVIVSTGAGASELVRHGDTGFVFPAGDSEALALCLQTALALSERERNEMGQKAALSIGVALDPATVAARRLKEYAAANAGQRKKAPEWLARVVQPGDPVPDPLGFLSELPLRGLIKHAARRIGRRLVP